MNKRADYLVLGFELSVVTVALGVLTVLFATNNEKLLAVVLGAAGVAFGLNAVDNIKKFIKFKSNQR